MIFSLRITFLPCFYSLGYVNSKISFYLQRDRCMLIDCMVSISKDVNAVQYLLLFLWCNVHIHIDVVCVLLCSVQRWMKKRVQSDRCRLPCCANGWPRWSDYSMMVITQIWVLHVLNHIFRVPTLKPCSIAEYQICDFSGNVTEINIDIPVIPLLMFVIMLCAKIFNISESNF